MSDDECPPCLGSAALDRAFPFHLHLDNGLRIRRLGRSLSKAMPALAEGDALGAHFAVRRPGTASTLADWRRHGHNLCTLQALGGCSLTLRGSAEFSDDGTMLLLVAPVLTSIEAMRALGLGFNDFAAHDAVGEMLMLARTTWMSAQDTERLAVHLRARTAQLDTILELGSNGVAYFDPAGLLQHTNGALLALLGLDRETTVGWQLDDLLDRIERLRCPLTPRPEILGDGARSGCSTTLQLIAPRQAVLRVTTRATDDGGRVFYLRDITAETEVDRMKSEFLTTAAHELRTPMVSIYGFTELLLNRPVPEARRRDVLQTVHRQTTRLIAMVNELLDLARIEARQGKDLDRQPVTLGPLVEDTVLQMAGVLAGHRVELDLPHAQVPLLLDRSKTMQALTNVLSNAGKYSAPGCRIRVESVRGVIEQRAVVGLRVIDEGMGMTADEQSRVFERFFRADPSGHVPGTGLGMCLVKEIVELHQGRVELQSAPGAGTTVTLWWPEATDPAGSGLARAGAEASPQPA